MSNLYTQTRLSLLGIILKKLCCIRLKKKNEMIFFRYMTKDDKSINKVAKPNLQNEIKKVRCNHQL